MKTTRLLLVIAMIGAACLSGFSQSKKNEASSREGLKKIAGPSHDIEFDIDINEAAIERSIEDALKSVEVTLKNLDIHIDPIQIDLKSLMMDINPNIAGIPDIDVETIDMDLDELDMGELDIDIDEDLNFNHKDQGDLEHKADDERSKGLKKID